MAANQGQHNTPLHVLVAAVTAAERGEPMPTNAQLAAEIGCVPHGVTMAVSRLIDAGLLVRIGDRPARRRLMVKRTGAVTAEAAE